MTLDLLITVVLCAASSYAGYSLRGHIHSVATDAAQAVKSATDKVK